jgi:hypothetical protein
METEPTKLIAPVKRYTGSLAFVLFLLDHLDELDTIEATLDALIATGQDSKPKD